MLITTSGIKATATYSSQRGEATPGHAVDVVLHAGHLAPPAVEYNNSSRFSYRCVRHCTPLPAAAAMLYSL